MGCWHPQDILPFQHWTRDFTTTVLLTEDPTRIASTAYESALTNDWETEMTDRLAIDGGPPAYTAEPISWPIHGAQEEKLLLEVLRSGNWSILSGTKVSEFNARFSRFQGAKYGVSVPNGTLALEMALEALGVGLGDEVITTAYTFVATATAVLSMGARPVFIDIDPNTNNIDPASIEAAITSRTKVIMPVHIGGAPCDMDAISDISERYGIPILEDACQAWGASWRSRPVGSIGICGAFSFQESKNITAGEGGITVTNNREVYDRMWAIHEVGRYPADSVQTDQLIGRDLRMTEWQGAILLAQLERLPEHNEHRQRSADLLYSGLEDVPGLTPMFMDERSTGCSWHLFQVRYNPAAFGGRNREVFLEAMMAEGVPCSGGYQPLPGQQVIQEALESQFGTQRVHPVPNAEDAGRNTVWLGQTLLLGDEPSIKQVIAAIQKIQRSWG